MTQKTNEAVTTAKKEQIGSITLKFDETVMIGPKEYTEITLRKPYAGNLKGISITQLQAGDTQQVIKFVAAISDWPTTAVERISLGDFNLLNNLVLGFLFPKNLNDLVNGLKESGAEIQVQTA